VRERLPDLLIRKGSMEPPTPITRPSRLRLGARRFFSRLLRFLLAPRCEL